MISQATRERLEEEIAKYPEPRGGLLAVLHLLQEEHRFISEGLAVKVAQLVGIRPVEVMEVVSFYNLFDSEPRGRNRVRVCTNLSCALRGSRELLAELASHLAVEVGGTTEDGRITLEHEQCLGACGYAPMMRVNDRYCEGLDVASAKRLLDELE